ncbi:PD-(D/E)XK nuclease family protein [Patescibacteria group bacterium]|nr:PD-(D/E)XK nuclease family protein [Patescibacteria group bacterium]MBU1500909.1 PD-(D/E)XK nuclease family protein [Patescibacteria group bacterium]MBU2080964.1 PD-(D/E)XK nuclease family protein [Patescibacteria group bacterium]MBU2124069.1 PD-(D/E)XK nuclease family protein [Patescibacteria group bacterium]MBU2194640.1 PD-(D/E)XK nuclease family protein [Patescibacteria group bacterium]
MAEFKKQYNPNRSSDWNHGGKKWRLSRSKIELFNECPRCFYLDNKLGTARPRGPAFTLNIAVDALLKKEFDVHRVAGTAHPLMEKYGIDAVPFVHKNMNTWRENFEGVEHFHEPTGFTISGAVDDIWVNKAGELIVVDYKATSKPGTIETLEDSSWNEQYKRQMGVYQWLLEKNGFSVSPNGYFVYANASADKQAFDAQLEFEVTVVPCNGETTWIDEVLPKIKETLESDAIPAVGKDCEFCPYREAAGKKLLALHRKAQK